jgi:hypothetical protein
MHTCEKCQKEFKIQKNLINHNNNTPNCNFKCNICVKRFSTKYVLQKHESVNCKQRYECNDCEKTYSTKYKLNYHNCKQNNIKKNANLITNNNNILIIY